jgi:hypothetical protein
MTITFEITDETAAIIRGEHYLRGDTKEQVAAAIASLAKANMEAMASHSKRTMPGHANRDIEAFKQLPQS